MLDVGLQLRFDAWSSSEGTSIPCDELGPSVGAREMVLSRSVGRRRADAATSTVAADLAVVAAAVSSVGDSTGFRGPVGASGGSEK